MDKNINKPKKIIVFDTETTGFSPIKNEIVQLSYILYDLEKQQIIYSTNPGDDFVNIDGPIPKETSDVHGITKDMTLDKRPIKDHLDDFIHYCDQADTFVGHNIKFDIGMIVGQIKKIMDKMPEPDPKYTAFLQKFQMTGKKLPENAYCTMASSKEVCARIRGTPDKQKNDKLMEVHRLLFNQIVGGQLHNALVDISVTLRVYLYLTLGVDICVTMTTNVGSDDRVFGVKDNNDICNLIRPLPIPEISEPQPSVPYDGELITSLTPLPNNEMEERKIMVSTIAKQLATELVGRVLQNAAEKSSASPTESICTTITLCSAILSSGQRKGKVCGRARISNGEFCSYHVPKTRKKRKLSVAPESSQDPIVEQVIEEEQMATIPVSKKPYSFFPLTGTRKNKIVPIGGLKSVRRRRTRKRMKKSRKHKK